MGRFINPFTDFGFKFLFGREVEKELNVGNHMLSYEQIVQEVD